MKRIGLAQFSIFILLCSIANTIAAKNGVLDYDPNKGITIRHAVEKPFLKTTAEYLKDNTLVLEKVQNEDIHHLTEIKEHIHSLIILNSPKVTDLTSIGRLTHLQRLELSHLPELDDLSALSNLNQLKTLIINDVNCQDITFLAPLTQLETLIFKNQPKAPLDITALSDKPNLKVLYFGGAQIKELSPLREAYALEELGLANTQVGDLSPIAQLTNLKKLDLTRVPAKNLKPIENLNQLQWIKIASTRFNDYQSLAKCTQLETLIAGQSRFNRLDVIEHMPNLTTLSLYRDPIQTLAPLSKATNLTTLNLQHMRGSLSPLSTLTSLKHLSLEKTRVTNPEVVSNLAALETLDLRDVTGFKDLSLLVGLPNLQKVHVRRGDYPANQTSLLGKRVVFH